jgi:ABC-type Fe3+-hydroxamate transport system substrate-binding protein
VRHAPAGADARIVSLVPSVTELLFDLGLGAQVVGRTAFCVHPQPAVKKARSVGGTKQVNVEKLAGLKPTHVIVNVDENPKTMVEAIAALGPKIVVTHPIEVVDNVALYRLMGSLFGRAAEAEALVARFEERLAALQARAVSLPERRVLYLIWRAPWMTVSADTYIARMLALVHWRTLCHDPKVRYPTIALTEALLAETDLVLFSSEPFPFKEGHIQDFRAAFPAHAPKARAIDGQRVSWYGSRAILGLDYLADFAG